MKKPVKRRHKIAVLCSLSLLLSGIGMKGSLEAASTDTVQLVVTPGVTYSVVLTSAGNYAPNAYNFGTVDLNVTTRTETAVTVQNDGNITSSWQVSAYQDGATWSLGNSTAADTAVLKALFNSTGGLTPLTTHYDTASGSTITASAKQASSTNLSTSSVVDTIAVGEQRDLHFMLHTPNTSGSGAAQSFRVYVTAVP